MEYKTNNEKLQTKTQETIQKSSITTEVFDYYSIKPKDINELIEFDIKIIDSIMSKHPNIKLYAIAISRYIPEFKEYAFKYRLWNELSLPNENNPEDEDFEFKEVVNFDKPIIEVCSEGNKYIAFGGIAEITSEFYKQNYEYFSRPMSFKCLFIASEQNIPLWISSLDELVRYSANNELILNLEEVIVNSIMNFNGVLIYVKDLQEFKEFSIYAKENYIKYLTP